jgi:hypothetical protein
MDANIARRIVAQAGTAAERRCSVLYGNIVPIEIEDEVSWLRHRVVRMRTILRFAKDPRTETGIRELIADAEARLDALEARRAAAVTKMK